MGAFLNRVVRIMVMSHLSAVSSAVPSIGAPDQGAYRWRTGRDPERWRSDPSTPYSIAMMKAHQVDFPLSLGA